MVSENKRKVPAEALVALTFDILDNSDPPGRSRLLPRLYLGNFRKFTGNCRNFNRVLSQHYERKRKHEPIFSDPSLGGPAVVSVGGP